MKIKFYDKGTGNSVFVGTAGIEGVPRVGEMVIRRTEEGQVRSAYKVVAISYEYDHNDELADARVLLERAHPSKAR